MKLLEYLELVSRALISHQLASYSALSQLPRFIIAIACDHSLLVQLLYYIFDRIDL